MNGPKQKDIAVSAPLRQEQDFMGIRNCEGSEIFTLLTNSQMSRPVSRALAGDRRSLEQRQLTLLHTDKRQHRLHARPQGHRGSGVAQVKAAHP